MFSICDSNSRGLNRRDFLRIGSLALGGMTLPKLLATQALASTGRPVTTGKSVIFLFLHGGPTQFETFDPKMSAPEGNRSVTGEIQTRIPGVTFGTTFPKLAALADKFTVIRSYRPGDGNHDIKPIVHRDFLNANLGSIYARVAGTNHPQNSMPTNVALFPQAVDPGCGPAQMGFGNWSSTGFVGSSYAPFVPGGQGNLLSNMQLRIPRDRLDDRRELLTQLDAVKNHIDRTGALESVDRFQEQAFDVILRGVADSFDLSREDPALIARYDTAPLVPVDSINKRWNNHRHYADNARSLGKLLLLARRLCEAGCGFITVTTNFVWDMHADQNNATVTEGMGYMGVPLDHALSAFIEDVEARGLGDKIMLVACGEMGRTPRVNRNGGRDHWGNLGPLLVYGGGLRMGQVIGQSNAAGGEPATEPITPRHVVSTIMHTLFDVGEVRILRGVPDDVARVITDDPIQQLMG
jgi:hypothetical protein